MVPSPSPRSLVFLAMCVAACVGPRAATRPDLPPLLPAGAVEVGVGAVIDAEAGASAWLDAARAELRSRF